MLAVCESSAAGWMKCCRHLPPCHPPCSEAELAQLAAVTAGCTGSDLAAVCREAAMTPVRELVAGWRGGGSGSGDASELHLARVRPVCCADLLAAVSKLAPPAAH